MPPSTAPTQPSQRGDGGEQQAARREHQQHDRGPGHCEVEDQQLRHVVVEPFEDQLGVAGVLLVVDGVDLQRGLDADDSGEAGRGADERPGAAG
jgi:hypothetical protein